MMSTRRRATRIERSTHPEWPLAGRRTCLRCERKFTPGKGGKHGHCSHCVAALRDDAVLVQKRGLL